MSHTLTRTATFAASILFTALVGWCSLTTTKHHRMTGIDRCMAMPVYAGPAGTFVGSLIGGAIVDAGAGPVQAINLTIVVDGEKRSIWRRQSEVMTWYVHVGAISANECHWTSPNLLPNGKWEPTPLEYGLDVPLWHRVLGGWSAHHGWWTIGDPI
jgi:hypothetical protein